MSAGDKRRKGRSSGLLDAAAAELCSDITFYPTTSKCTNRASVSSNNKLPTTITTNTPINCLRLFTLPSDACRSPGYTLSRIH
jgi:hypothetical protein